MERRKFLGLAGLAAGAAVVGAPAMAESAPSLTHVVFRHRLNLNDWFNPELPRYWFNPEIGTWERIYPYRKRPEDEDYIEFNPNYHSQATHQAEIYEDEDGNIAQVLTELNQAPPEYQELPIPHTPK